MLPLKKLKDVVNVGIHIDDAITSSDQAIIKDWNKYLRFYLFNEAGLVTSPLKNSTEGKANVEFCGFEIQKESKEKDVMTLTMRDSTRHKLEVVVADFRKHRKFVDFSRLEGYMTWYSGIHPWFKGSRKAINVAKIKLMLSITIVKDHMIKNKETAMNRQK
jgi:hypothetical protein